MRDVETDRPESGSAHPSAVPPPGVVDDADPPEVRLARPSAGVVVVTLDRPGSRNAMGPVMTEDWDRTMAALRDDPDLRAVVVTGAGGSFCAGGDLGWLLDVASAEVPLEEVQATMRTFYATWLGVHALPVPTVAAIDGPAVGAGLALALACDLRVAGADARLAVPFSRLGLHPGMGTTRLLPDRVGRAAALDLLLTGRSLDGEQAHRLGLVDRVQPAGSDVLAAALEVVQEMLLGAPLATRSTLLRMRVPEGELDDVLDTEADAQARTLVSEDGRSGLQAARDRRSPSFRGR